MKARLFSSLILTASVLSGCSSGVMTYTVTFDYPGYEPVQVKSGEKVTKPADPVKESDNKYRYVFNAWYYGKNEWDFDNDTVTKDITLVPTFNIKTLSYRIDFMNGDELLQSSLYDCGEIPVYSGETPYKAADEGYTYVFSGWDHEITKAVKDDVYNAVFEKKEKGLNFVNVPNIYYPYDEKVREYLETDNADVSDYCHAVENQSVPLTIDFQNDYENVSSLTFRYAAKEDFSDAVSVSLNVTDTSVKLRNLLKNTKYYISLAAVLADGEEKTVTSSFMTADLGPRTIYVDGVYNTRDIGGYLTEDGKSVRQGMIIRGGAMTDSTDSAYDGYVDITEEGKKTMSEELGIKSDFDLRAAEENLNLTDSPIPGASLTYYAVDGYMSAYNHSEAYENVFKDLAKPSSYPLYVHCTGGADRTGTVCALIEAMLGMSEADIIHDYEFTTFSIYGTRSSKDMTPERFRDFWAKLKTYDGDTLKEQTASYLLSIGVSQDEIDSIRDIMLA